MQLLLYLCGPSCFQSSFVSPSCITDLFAGDECLFGARAFQRFLQP